MSELERIRRVYARRRLEGRDARYTVFDRGNLFRLLTLERDLAGSFRAEELTDLATLRLLDIGCGGGWWLRTLLRWGAAPEHLAGIDLLPEAAAAAQTIHPALRIEQGSAEHLPFADGAFDVVSQFTVFSSILERQMQETIAGEMARVLRPGGIALWYDFTVNPANRDTRGISRARMSSLFPEWHVRCRRATLAPPLARLIAPRSWTAAAILDMLPPLRTHLIATMRRP